MKRASLAFGVLLCSVVLVDCGSKMLGSPEDLGSEASAVVSAGSSIVASQITASGNLTPGEMPGDFSVTDSGQASYSVPLWTPEGPMGMSPSLAIEYDSSAGAGPLGVGFFLSGDVISMISRCRKTIPIDGYVSPIELFGTTYCLDGKRLVPTNTAGEFRTQADDGSKIAWLSLDTNGVPTGWTVSLRNGRVLTYGAKADKSTQLRGTVKATYCPLNTSTPCDQAFVAASGTATLSWALERVADRVAQISGAVSNSIGNYMTISYATFSSGSTVKYGSDFDFKEMLISQIDYGYGTGTTAHRQVKFTYGQTRYDARYTWVSGLPIMSTKLLTKIDMYGPNPSTMQLLKTYNVNYQAQSSLGVSGRSRIGSIAECDNVIPTATCKKATSFQWEDGKNTYRDVWDGLGTNIDPTSPLTALDYNGDGKTDLMIHTKPDATTGVSHVQFYTSQMGPELAQPNTPNPTVPAKLEATSLTSDQEYTIWGISPVDLDGDARSDLAANVRVPDGGTAYRQIFDLYRNAGNQFDYVAESGSPTNIGYDSRVSLFMTPVFPDLDGDGLPESVQVGLLKANNPANNNQPDYSQLIFRRNMTGNIPGNMSERSALVEGTRSYSSLSAQYYDIGNGLRKPYSGYPTYIVDIDGSGRGALLVQDSWFDTSQPQPYVNVTKQTGVDQIRAIQMTPAGVNGCNPVYPVTWCVKSNLATLAAYDRGASGFHYVWLDVNGDGLPDAIDVQNDTTTAGALAKCTDEAPDISRIRMNTGAGFKRYTGSYSQANSATEYAVNTRTDAGVLVGDMNQDGLDDILLTGRAIRYTSPTTGTTDRGNMRLLVASTGSSQSSHVVVGALPKTLDGNEILAVDTFFVMNSNNNNLKMDSGVPAALGDFNGDGLLDIAVVRSTALHFYIHQGFKADLLKSVDTGTGRHLAIQYAATSDPAVYRRMRDGQQTPGAGVTGPWEQPPECKYPLNCLTSGQWVVSRFDVTNDQKVNAGHHMFYSEGRMSRREKWLGLAERWDYDEANGGVDVTTYDNRTAGASEHFPFAFLPAQRIRIARDSGGAPGTYDPHRSVTTNHYQEVANIFAPSAYSARLMDTADVEENLNVVPPSIPVDNLIFDTDYSTAQLANAITYFTYDQFDNLKREQRINADGLVLDKNYTPVSNPTLWLMNMVGGMTETSSNNITGESVTRTRSYAYYPNTLLLNTETIQGGGTADIRSVITYTRGAGALGQVTQKTVTATSTADDTSVPVGTTLTRTETTTYDAVDGVTVASTTNPLNQTTLLAYHGGLGVLAQAQDPNGVITSYQYDTFGRLRKRTVPTAGDFTVTFESPLPTFPSLISSIVPALGPTYATHSTQVGGEETIVTYNMNGKELVRQTKAGDGAYRYVLTRYTATPGQVASVSLPFRSTDTVLRQEVYLYDSFGRKIQTTHADGSTQTAFFTPRFGPLGYVKTTTDELNHKREEAYRDDGQIASVTEYVGGTTALTNNVYGPFGLLKAVSPPNVVSPSGATKGAGNSITYDVLGRRITYTEGNAGPNTRSYNAFGDVVKEVDATGTPTFFKRDALGRITSKSNALDGGGNTYVWDTAPRGTVTGAVAKGKLATSTSFDGTTTSYTYDTYARPDLTTSNIKGRSYAMKQLYVATTGKVGEIDYPTAGTTGSAQLKVTYGYDSAGGISSVTKVGSSTPYWKATHYWSDGQIDQENDATAMVTTRVYDDNRRWTKSIKTAGSTTIQNVAYGHDVAGNVTSRTDTDSSVNTTEGFTYDETDKLKKWTFTSGANTWTTDYGPGASGVIQQTKTGTGATSLAYNYFGTAASQLPHAVRQVTGSCTDAGTCTTPAYDAKGRTTSSVTGLTSTYTSFDLPKTFATGSILATFSYDANSQRAAKDYAVSGIAGTDHWVTTYVGGVYERHTDRLGVVSHVMYIRGPHNRVVAQETWTESGSSVTTSPILYHHDDIIGSTVVTNTGATSSSATRLRYDPYGLRISPTNPTQAPTVPPSGLPTRIGYTGHEMDDEFNLINMKGRIYDPKIARFMTPDPMVSAPNNGNGYDRYGYGGNNPMKYTDPSGFIYCLSDIWLMQQGYDIDFVNFMRTFAAWRKTKEDREWDAREAAKAGYAAAQTAQVRDNKGRVVGTVTILEYDRQDGKKGINILVGFKGNGTVQFDALNFIQTIITNSPLGNNPANAPYNDHQPGDKGPFYYTAEGLAAYSNNGGFDIRFFDDPWRRDSAGQFYWQGELSLIGLTDGSYQILETFGYGFSFGASGGLTLLPIRIVTPSPYQRGSVPRD